MRTLYTAILSTAALFALPFASHAASIDAGYADTISQTGYTCATHPAYSLYTGSTIETYMDFVSATTDSITFRLHPSFDDSSCNVKLPIGYSVFNGMYVDYTDNIATPVDERTSIILNADSTGEMEYTVTGLLPGTEYQFRSYMLTQTSEGLDYEFAPDTAYYSTAVPPVTDPSIDADGVVSWTAPEGVDPDNVKVDVTFYQVTDTGLQYVIGTTKYSSPYEYYDFYNNLYEGNYVVVLTASMKKFYDSFAAENVDQRIWGTPVTLAFTTERG